MSSRPTSPAPDSPSSLRDATATIDKLTIALTNYTRAPSPEPPAVSTCCCGREDCETTKAWAAFKAKLESRLVLSAEVGQALLERHEAYVRRHEIGNIPSDSPLLALQSPDMKRTEEQVEARVAELLRENAVLEKRLSQALVNHEVADVAHQNTLRQLKHAQERVAQFSAQNARLVGVQSRLESALQEKDDIQQERDSAIQRARIAEARMASLKEKCSKLQTQVTHLREDVDVQRSQRHKLSADIISDARSRLQQMQQHLVEGSVVDDGEVVKVLESLVANNEALKHDNVELQNLLSSTREELRTLQVELEERRADNIQYPGDHAETIRRNLSGRARSPLSPSFSFGTAPVPSVMHTMFQRPEAGPSSPKRSQSVERSFRRNAEPLTPETDRRPLSPSDFVDTRRNSVGQPRLRPMSSRLNFEDADDDRTLFKPSRAQISLLSLTRSRAVQTEGIILPGLTPLPLPHNFGDSSHDGYSETSSLDANPSVVGVIVERTTQLLNRLVQADALTLTNRLKRQRLLGADISHLSRATVCGILNESNNLRAQFRAFLEDDKVVSTCTRRDLRALFKLFKDMLTEMGQLRVTLNDVILDPTVAGRVSEMALHPSKTGEQDKEASGAGLSAPAWIAPLSKLLGLPTGSGQDEAASRALSPPVRSNSRTGGRPPPRIVPKREAALSASAMTVNVEFSGAGVGRAVASAASEPSAAVPATSSSNQLSAISSDSSRSVMDIFAGAPRPADTASDPWIVVPNPRRGAAGGRRFDLAGGATIGRSALKHAAAANYNESDSASGLSRVVDAVIDSQTSPTLRDETTRDVVSQTLLERTLRPRGLSDSSIRTTYLKHDSEEQRNDSTSNVEPSRSDRLSMLQNLSRRMQNFRFASGSFAARPVGAPTTSLETTEAVPSLSRPHTPANALTTPDVEALSPSSRSRRAQDRSSMGNSLFTNLNIPSWTPASLPVDGEELEPESGRYIPPTFYMDRSRGEAATGRAWVKGREA